MMAKVVRRPKEPPLVEVLVMAEPVVVKVGAAKLQVGALAAKAAMEAAQMA
jgi:hypothetical protein